MGTAIEERTVDVRQVRVRVLSAGAGPPLLYLHGAGDQGEWISPLDAWSGIYSVYRPDHPGFNGSDADRRIRSVHDLAFVYLDIMDRLGLERCTLVGSSLGGWVAADLACIEPLRFDRLLLIGPAGLRPPEPYESDVFLMGPVELAEATYHSADGKARAVEAAGAIESDPEALERYLRNRMMTAHLGWNPYMHDPALEGRLHRVRCPTLVAWGAHDRIVPASCARRFTEAIPGSLSVVIPGAGHLPHIECPAEFDGATGPFMSGAENYDGTEQR